MKRKTFSHIKLLDKRTIGKKVFYLRHDFPEKRSDYYCVRDSKFNKMFETYSFKKLEQQWDIFVSLLQNPNNPYRTDDIIYEDIPAAKKPSNDYKFYQVIHAGKKSVFVRPVETRTETEFGLLKLIPLKNHFIGEEIIKLKVEIIQNNYSSKLAYGIKSKNGQWSKLRLDYIPIPSQYDDEGGHALWD